MLDPVRCAAHRILERAHQKVWFVGSVTRQTWFLHVVLVTISAVGSWEFACIMPCVALAVAAEYTFAGRAALLAVAAIWLVNQVTGFAVLGYRWTVDTISRGFAIGAAAFLAAGLAGAAVRLAIRNDSRRHRRSFRAGIWCLRRRVVFGDLWARRSGCLHKGHRPPYCAAEPWMDCGFRRGRHSARGPATSS